MDRKVVTRFAPSPTGYLHVGSLRTALYSYLYAKKHDGTFILRVEDTDRERFVADSMQNMLESMYWAGIVPDEGVLFDENRNIVQMGSNGPYIQSERLSIYKKYSDELLAKGAAYRCFCTRERLDEVRTQKQNNGEVPKYDRHCLHLTNEEIQSKLSSGESHVLRLRIPDEGVTIFYDEVRGDISYPNKDLDDQVLMKSDGFPTYHMAVVVDDHTMGVTHIIRGEEWISSTPKHVILYKAFGWDIPSHSHLPLLLNADRTKLSKRQGDVAVTDYINKGYLPEAMVNFVAFLGWNPGDDREIFSLSELAEAFSLEKVSKSGAFFNTEKLDWFNREYLKVLTDESIEIGIRNISKFLSTINGFDDAVFKKLIPVIRERLNTFKDIDTIITSGEIDYFFSIPHIDETFLPNKKSTISAAKEHLYYIAEALENIPENVWDAEEVKAKVWDYASEKGRGDVLWPLRYCLSGKEKSPDPFTIAGILGKDATLFRIHKVIDVK